MVRVHLFCCWKWICKWTIGVDFIRSVSNQGFVKMSWIFNKTKIIKLECLWESPKARKQNLSECCFWEIPYLYRNSWSRCVLNCFGIPIKIHLQNINNIKFYFMFSDSSSLLWTMFSHSFSNFVKAFAVIVVWFYLRYSESES